MTRLSHEGRVALVTGGAGAIGGAIASELVRCGARVALVDAQATVGVVADGLAESGGAVTGHRADVTDPSSVSEALASIVSIHGGVDILVNCAGIVVRREGRKVAADEMTLDEWRRGIDVNLTGVFLCSQAVLPSMKRAKWGRILTLSSQGGRTGGRFSSVDYGAAKAGVIGFSRTLAAEVGPHGITVNCLAPGRVVTPMTDNPLEMEQNDVYIAELPIPRMGTAQEIAATVAFLSSDCAGYITGSTIDINGGGFMA